jgi:hypothetical protein
MAWFQAKNIPAKRQKGPTSPQDINLLSVIGLEEMHVMSVVSSKRLPELRTPTQVSKHVYRRVIRKYKWVSSLHLQQSKRNYALVKLNKKVQRERERERERERTIPVESVSHSPNTGEPAVHTALKAVE